MFANKAQIFAFIDSAREGRSLSATCAYYEVTRAGYYAWKTRTRSRRSEQDRWLLTRIQAMYAASDGTYGAPRIVRALRQAGIRVGRKRVARLMQQAGLKARATKLYHANPGSHAFFLSVPNRVQQISVDAPDQVWVGDLTYLKVQDGWRYLAVVMDRYSRRIIGWTLGANKDVKLTLRALNHALINRRPRSGLIFHSDRGIEYAAYQFRIRLAAVGFLQSMNRRGKPTDNAHMESFFHSLKSDVIHGAHFANDAQLREAIRRYVEWYNRRRLHSALSYRSPVDFERAAA